MEFFLVLEKFQGKLFFCFMGKFNLRNIGEVDNSDLGRVEVSP